MTDAAFPRQAIVLAGGLGTRLRQVVSDVPKPLAPIAGRPFLQWLLDGLARQGIARVILATGYKGEMIRDMLGDSHAGMALTHVQEPSALGTGGALWAALAHVTEDRAFALNGDTWLGAPLAALAMEAPEADLVMAVRHVDDATRYGNILVSGNQFAGLKPAGTGGAGLVNAGVYVLRRDLPQRRPMPPAFSLEADILTHPAPLDVRVYATEAPFLDIGTPEDFAAAQALIPAWAAA